MADGSNITDATSASIVTHPREQMRLLREKLAEAAQRLIDAMDAIDGDPDLEPSLGSLGSSVTNPWATIPPWAAGGNDDREDEHDGSEPSGDEHEPNLGAPENHQRQIMWAQGDGHEREEECEDEGAQCDDEGFNSDDEPNADDQDNSLHVTAFALNQEGTNWAYGDDRPNAKQYMRPAEAGTPLHVLDMLRKDRENMAGQKSEIDDFKSDGKGNASFVKDGAPWIGTRLTPDAK